MCYQVSTCCEHAVALWHRGGNLFELVSACTALHANPVGELAIRRGGNERPLSLLPSSVAVAGLRMCMCVYVLCCLACCRYSGSSLETFIFRNVCCLVYFAVAAQAMWFMDFLIAVDPCDVCVATLIPGSGPALPYRYLVRLCSGCKWLVTCTGIKPQKPLASCANPQWLSGLCGKRKTSDGSVHKLVW